MAGPATLKDVAAAASVSVSTASRVLRGDLGLVGAETAARVKEAAAELNYYPSAAAQALVQGRTRTWYHLPVPPPRALLPDALTGR